MRLNNIKGSRNVQDRRSQRSRVSGGARIGGFGLIIVLAIGYFTGIDVSPLLNQSGGGQVTTSTSTTPLSVEEQQVGEFSSRVLATTEQVWSEVFAKEVGRPYTPPVLVLFSEVTPSPCGNASGATGPFYCPIDQKAYLDTAFFAVMSQQMGADGDFAAAYVIAHEIGHHVQNELDILDQAQKIQAQSSKAQANAISVRIELQADCLSGIWASYVEGLLDPGDVAEAMNAAEKIGDDYLMRQAGRVPNPHAFTHGTSEQRQRWFAQGYQGRQLSSCDTFSAQQL